MDDPFWAAGESYEQDVLPEDVDAEELRRGTLVEMEHTRDIRMAAKIALDHLAEYPRYYDALGLAEWLLEHDLLDEAVGLLGKAGIYG